MKQKNESCFDGAKAIKSIEITKRSHIYKGYASTYNAEILNYFDPELQLKDTVSAIKNKLIDLLSDLRRFKFVAKLVLEFIKIGSDDETKYSTIYSNLKAETAIMKMRLMMHLNQFILQLYQTFKNLLEKVRVGLLIQS